MAQMVKASACNAGDLGLIPGSGRLGNGNPLQYSCLENPMDGGAWWATVHGVAKTQTWLRDFTFRTHPVDCRTHWILRPCSTRVTVPGSYPQPINTLLTYCIHQWKVILYPLCKWASPWCPGDKRQLKCLCNSCPCESWTSGLSNTNHSSWEHVLLFASADYSWV